VGGKPQPFPPIPTSDQGRYVMCGTFAPLPSPLMGEGSGGGEDSTRSPIPTFPAKRGRGSDLPLSAPFEGKGRVEGGVTGR
jgi:hypothetical protein